MANLFIGTSGWIYNHWAEVFYPKSLPKDRWLEYYCHHFSTVEINNTFYRLPPESAFLKWNLKTPDNFTFSVKASRYITHIKKLSDPKESTEVFLSRANLLGEKLGPILFQLPPQFKINIGKLEGMLKIIEKKFRYTFEFRHPSWFCENIYQLLQKQNIALCIADSPNFPTVLGRTADFCYFRLHGATVLYGSRYSKEEIKNWATYIERYLKEGADVYVYFDNDAFGFAVANAKEMLEILGDWAI